MLPTKGYFQDIECPFYNTTCGRPYCHFRHKRKPNENVEESPSDPRNNPVPTYKPTPKSELANIHNKNHIPISYVPDLAFKRERIVRPVRIEKPTYKPTPLSILSSATKPDASIPENHEHKETIKDIQENIASNVYDPSKSEINFEELTSEFDLIDDIINDTESKSQSLINKNLIKLESDIEKEQYKLNVLQSELKSDEVGENLKPPELPADVKLEIRSPINETPTPKDKSTYKITRENKEKPKNEQKEHKSYKESRNSREKVKEDIKVKYSRDKSRDKSKEKEKHRKEERKHSSRDKKEESKDKSKGTEKSHKRNKNDKSVSENYSDSESSSSETSIEKQHAQPKKGKKKDNDKYKSIEKSKTRKSRSRSNSVSKTKEKKPKHKSRKKSRSRSRSRHKDKKRSRSRDKKSPRKSHKHKGTSKSSHTSHSKAQKSKSSSKKSHDKKEERKSSSPDSRLDHDSELTKIDGDSSEFPYDINFDLEDEDETMRECYRIFNEYKPEPMSETKEPEKKDLFEDDSNTAHQGKKRTAHAGAESSLTHSKLPPPSKPKIVTTPGQILANRYKIAKMAQASNEQESIMNEIKSITTQQTATKRPATSLLEAARIHKIKKLQQLKAREEQKSSVNVLDDILNGVHQPSSSQIKMLPKKIAAVPNVALIEKAKERISLIKQQRVQNVKTIAQSQKAGRVAHIPEYSLSDIPDVLQAEKSKLPVNVRTRFLTMLADECFKLYSSKEDSYSRALNEEFACYEKCKVLATYRNSAMLAVNRIRKEIQERESKGLGPLLSGESTPTDKGSAFTGKIFYNHVRKWVLTEEELDIHGYPRESDEKGKAIINNRKAIDYSMVDENERKCSRCSKIYQVDDDGWPLYEEECMYHPLKKRTLRGEQIYLCCKSNDETGCAMSDTHVCDGLEKHLLEGYQTTLPPESNNDLRSITVYALDCEMCYTTKGLELTRVTIIDTDCKTVYESLVKPLNPIIDYNTRFSGITKEQMDRTSTSILQVQANILHLCNSETILVGHSLESDLKALKIVHGTIIDTSVLFPHKMGLPHKKALRALASEFLKKIIQNDVSGHDSAEDAVACMELIKWKLKEELKTRTK